MPKRPVLKLLSYFESDTEAARMIGVSKNAVSKWKKGARITAERAKQFEEVTNGFVTRKEFRPDLFEEMEHSVNHELTR